MRRFLSIFSEEKKRKITINVGIIILVVFTLGFLIFSSLGHHEEIVTIDDTITLKNIDYQEENGIFTYTANLSVTEKQYINYINIILDNHNNDTIVTLVGYVGKELDVNDEFVIKASTDADTKALDHIDYEHVKLDNN